jgi:copper transport protein
VTGLRIEGGPDDGNLEEPVEVVADLSRLTRSAYRVSWSTLSSDDLHATEGVLVFGVGESVTAVGLDEPSPPPVEVAMRWLLLVGVAGGIGGPLAGHLLTSAGAREPTLVRVRRWVSRAPLAAAGLAVLLLVDQLVGSGATEPGRVLGGGYGVRWGLREAGLLLLAAAGGERVRRARWQTGAVTAGAALACVGSSLLGHAGAGARDLTRVAASAAHLGAATTWAGGLVTLTAVLVASRRTRHGQPGDGDVLRAAFRGFRLPAAGCVGVMVATGVYLSSEAVGSVDAALFTTYGRALMLKVVLAAAAGALALLNSRALHSRAPRKLPRRTIVGEAMLGLGVIGLAAVLSSGQPAMEPQLVRSVDVGTAGPVDAQVADLLETIDLRPGEAGPNVVIVEVFDTRRPAPAPVRAVDVQISGVGPVLKAESLGNGRWSVGATLPAGAVAIRVVAHRSGLADVEQSSAWTVAPTSVSGLERVSTAPIRDVLRSLALGLSLVVVAGWCLALTVALARRRHDRRSGAPGAPPDRVVLAAADAERVLTRTGHGP